MVDDFTRFPCGVLPVVLCLLVFVLAFFARLVLDRVLFPLTAVKASVSQPFRTFSLVLLVIAFSRLCLTAHPVRSGVHAHRKVSSTVELVYTAYFQVTRRRFPRARASPMLRSNM